MSASTHAENTATAEKPAYPCLAAGGPQTSASFPLELLGVLLDAAHALRGNPDAWRRSDGAHLAKIAYEVSDLQELFSDVFKARIQQACGRFNRGRCGGLNPKQSQQMMREALGDLLQLGSQAVDEYRAWLNDAPPRPPRPGVLVNDPLDEAHLADVVVVQYYTLHLQSLIARLETTTQQEGALLDVLRHAALLQHAQQRAFTRERGYRGEAQQAQQFTSVIFNAWEVDQGAIGALPRQPFHLRLQTDLAELSEICNTILANAPPRLFGPGLWALRDQRLVQDGHITSMAPVLPTSRGAV